MSLTNPDSVVTEERLSEFYAGIRPYLGGMPDVLANKFNRSDLYSTDEKIVGVWTDGKPLYQKTWTNLKTPNNNVGEVLDLSSMDIDTCVNVDAFILNSGSNFPLPWIYDTNRYTTIWYDGTKKVYVRVTGNNETNKDLILTLKYTKSGDSAISIGSDTDYSTNEKIVGTWIDGKPLWQKTIECGALPNNATKNVPHGVTNFDMMCISNAFAYSTQWNLVTPLPYVHKTNSAYEIQLYVQDSNIIITTGSDHSSDNGYVTLQYTKTS